jgi:hypothetical protein
MEAIKANLVNLCDVGTILGLPCVLPMLEFVNALMKFTQAKDVFICHNITTIEFCQVSLLGCYGMYFKLTQMTGIPTMWTWN